MATFRQTMKHGLLHYPTIFPNPINVCEHLFCVIGNGYEWHNGELVDKFEPTKADEPLAMQYPDRTEKYPESAELERLLPALAAERKLKNLAERMRMKFVEDNIETILEGNPTAVYFGNGPRGYYFLKGICLQYARAFHFPEDIKKDWAEALYKFLNHWLYSLNVEYGVSSSGDISFWPKDIQEARTMILETRNRLHPYAHNGQSYEQYVTQMKKCFERVGGDNT